METKKINNIKIQRVITNKIEEKKIGGFGMFPEVYANIYICSKKKSGKTTLIYNILKKCANKNTHVWIFSPTIKKDETFKMICEMLENKGCNVSKYLHFIDEDGSNIIDEVINELINEGSDGEQEEGQEEEYNDEPINKPLCLCKFGNEEQEEDRKQEKEEKPKKEKKNKKNKIYPEQIFVCDDLASDLRNKAIGQLLIKNRHFKSKVILSGHNVTNLLPQARANIDYCIVFKGMSDDKIKVLHNDLNLSMDFDKFLEIYNEATLKPYSFLWISTADDKLRCGFDKDIII
jgi:hypothetical protein